MSVVPKAAQAVRSRGFGVHQRKKGWLEGAKIFLFIGFPVAFTVLQARPEVMAWVIQDRQYVRFPAEATEEGIDVEKIRRTAKMLKSMSEENATQK